LVPFWLAPAIREGLLRPRAARLLHPQS